MGFKPASSVEGSSTATRPPSSSFATRGGQSVAVRWRYFRSGRSTPTRRERFNRAGVMTKGVPLVTVLSFICRDGHLDPGADPPAQGDEPRLLRSSWASCGGGWTSANCHAIT